MDVGRADCRCAWSCSDVLVELAAVPNGRSPVEVIVVRMLFVSGCEDGVMSLLVRLVSLGPNALPGFVYG